MKPVKCPGCGVDKFYDVKAYPQNRYFECGTTVITVESAPDTGYFGWQCLQNQITELRQEIQTLRNTLTAQGRYDNHNPPKT